MKKSAEEKAAKRAEKYAKRAAKIVSLQAELDAVKAEWAKHRKQKAIAQP